jgi:hypothetical protein
MAMSHEQKLVLWDLIKPRLDELTYKINVTYKNGTKEEIDTLQNEIAVLQSICNRFNIKF